MAMPDSILITGGAGFIGVNVAAHYLAAGQRVVIFDNFSRAGTEQNLAWLRAEGGKELIVLRGDVRSPDARFQEEVERARVLFHFAAQVAVTTSVTDPATDFAINALGTFNVLEAVRRSTSRPIVLYSSTNKVYGKLAAIPVTELGSRYAYTALPHGVPESVPLDFYSPYGCSKGSGDQYVIDYARIFGLRTVVFRQSCIYGPHQFGLEDQGWVAWFTIRALQGQPVVIYGDGKQVRDILFIDDLVGAYEAAISRIDQVSGRAYNIGGGPAFTLSLLELIDLLGREHAKELPHSFGAWRPGDQRIFVSDIQKAKAELGWEPRVGPEAGVGLLADWLTRNQALLASVLA
jgi:CDP-paratose 2-epimerase